jgi:hypothetical protein
VRKKTLHGVLPLYVYAAVVAVLGMVGYLRHGLFAFRDAALLYNALFAGFAAYAYDERFLRRCWPLVLLFGIVVWCAGLDVYYSLTICVALAVLVRMHEGRQRVAAVVAAFFVLAVMPWTQVFSGSRTFIVSNAVALIVWLTAAFRCFGPRVFPKRWFGLLACAAIVGFLFCADRNALRSMVDVSGVKAVFVRNDDIAKRLMAEKGYRPKDLTPMVCRQERLAGKDLGDGLQRLVLRQTKSPTLPTDVPVAIDDIVRATSTEKPLQESTGAPETRASKRFAKPKESLDADVRNKNSAQVPAPEQLRDLETAKNNVVFRLFIWRDLFRALVSQKAWLGFGLGYPFRSPTIEALHWAISEWERDGWVSAHNTWFYILFKFGIIGLLMVVAVWSGVFAMTYVFWQTRDFVGLSGCTVLLNWMFGSCFQPFLEQPFYSVVFWLFFGVVYARARRIRADLAHP